MIVVLGTEPGSNRGGIATAISNFCLLMEENSTEYKAIVTHRPSNSKFQNSRLFILVFLRLFFLRIVSLIKREKFVVYLHVGPKGSLVRKLMVAIFTRGLIAKVVSHHHSPAFKEYLESKSAFYYILKMLSLCSNENLVLTEWWKELYSVSGIRNTLVVPNCIDVVESKDCEIENGRLISIARLVEEKNVQEVIKSLLYLPEKYTLCVAGDGPYRSKLESLVEDLRLNDRVDFLGWIDSEKKNNILSCSAAFVLPSKYDSFGMVFVEALSCGIPVIYGDHPAIKSSVGDLYGALGCSSNDAKEIAERIITSQKNSYDRSLIRSSLSKKYSKEVVSNALLSVLRG